MTGALVLAPGLRARCHLAAARVRGGRGSRLGRGDRVGRLPVRPAPLRIPAWACYPKDEVFGLCEALARAERALTRAGEPGEAARVAAAFDVLESGLVRGPRTLVSRGTARTPWPGS